MKKAPVENSTGAFYFQISITKKKKFFFCCLNEFRWTNSTVN